MSNNPDRSWLKLAIATALSGLNIHALQEKLGGAGDIVAASPEALEAAGLTARQRRVLAAVPEALLDDIYRWLEHSNHHFVSLDDARYPSTLRSLVDAPAGLFVDGDLTLLNHPSLAIVGSRNPTAGGSETARDFARHLAAAGLGIVSGLADGIDAAAHRGALAAHGVTIAVLGTGIDVCYPQKNRSLFEEIQREGALVSEYPPGREARPWQFPSRNRIISGLTLGTLVVEATQRSGSLITARLAGEQGRSVFAIPGSIHNPLARGCHQLIRQGALLVESSDDIYQDIGPKLAAAVSGVSVDHTDPERAAKEDREDDADYQRVLDAMGWDPVAPDTVVERSGLTAAEVSSMLLIMELRGDILPAPGGHYVRSK